MSQDNNWQQQVWQQPQPQPQQGAQPAYPQSRLRPAPAAERPSPAPPKKSRGWIVALVAVILCVFGTHRASACASCTSRPVAVVRHDRRRWGPRPPSSDLDYLTS